MNKTERAKIHQELFNKKGEISNINKVIQELNELAEELRDYKTAYINGTQPVNFSNILEERCDVENCLEKLDVFFRWKEEGIEERKNNKMQVAANRLHMGK